MTIPNVGEIWKYRNARQDGGHDFVMITRINHRKQTANATNIEDVTDLREIVFENVKHWTKVS